MQAKSHFTTLSTYIQNNSKTLVILLSTCQISVRVKSAPKIHRLFHNTANWRLIVRSSVTDRGEVLDTNPCIKSWKRGSREFQECSLHAGRVKTAGWSYLIIGQLLVSELANVQWLIGTSAPVCATGKRVCVCVPPQGNRREVRGKSKWEKGRIRRLLMIYDTLHIRRFSDVFVDQTCVWGSQFSWTL